MPILQVSTGYSSRKLGYKTLRKVIDMRRLARNFAYREFFSSIAEFSCPSSAAKTTTACVRGECRSPVKRIEFDGSEVSRYKDSSCEEKIFALYSVFKADGFQHITFCDGSRTLGHFCSGVAHGPMIEFSDTDWGRTSNLSFAGTMKRGRPSSRCWKHDPVFDTFRYGDVDTEGDFSGDDIVQVTTTETGVGQILSYVFSGDP